MHNIAAIQGLRAAAALAVAAVHFNQIWVWLSGLNDAPLVLSPLASGVDLFFLISGFVMVISSESLYGSPDAARQFMARRLARIVLPYWVATFIAIPLMQLPFTWDQLAASLLFIPWPNVSGAIVPMFGVGWTLNFEMFFYVLFALALLGPRERVVPAVCAVLAAMVGSGALGMPAPPWLKFLSDPIVLEFAIGMGVALAWRRNIALPAWLRVLLIVAGIGAVWLSAQTMPPSHWRVISWGLPAAAVLTGAVLGPPPPLGSLTRPIVALGDASYSIYLLHGLVGAALMRLWEFPSMHRVKLETAIAIAALVTIALSLASYRWLERPSTSALKRLAAFTGNPRTSATKLAEELQESDR